MCDVLVFEVDFEDVGVVECCNVDFVVGWF